MRCLLPTPIQPAHGTHLPPLKLSVSPILHRICRPMMPSTLSQSTTMQHSSSPSFPSPLTLFDSRVTVVASARGMRCSHATFKHKWQGRALLSETQLRKCGECNASWMSQVLAWYGQESAAHSSAAHSISPYATLATEYAATAMPIHPRLAGSMRYFVFASKPRSE